MCGSNPLDAAGKFAKKALAPGAAVRREVVGGLRDIGVLPESAATQQADAAASAAAGRAAADAEASSIASARIRAQRKAMRDNSLLTGAGGSRSTLGV